jgi:hypothetical protein
VKRAYDEDRFNVIGRERVLGIHVFLECQEHVKQVLIFVDAAGCSLLLVLQNDGVDDVEEAFPVALDLARNAADEHREA